MKVWLMMGLTVTWALMAQAATSPDVVSVKDSDGKEVAVLVACNSCQTAAKDSSKCHSGVEDGWLNGVPCGKCMLGENSNAAMRYPDLRFTGKLVDGSGEPAKDRFLRLFIANGWTVKTRTAGDGSFLLILGGTTERKPGSAVVVDLGARVDLLGDKGPYYAFFLMPPGYKTCPANAGVAPASKPKPKPTRKKH
jgi:hypothetical protein